MLSLTLPQKAILCELLVRGPQAPGALKPRVARMGYQAQPAEILDVLEEMARRPGRPEPLVEQQPRRPRERDNRWGHLLGPGDEAPTAQPSLATAEVAPPTPDEPPADIAPVPVLGDRVEKLERQVEALHAEVFRLRRLLEPE